MAICNILGDTTFLIFSSEASFSENIVTLQSFEINILDIFSISIFVYEFLSINLIRLKNKKNIFEAGQDHLHHQLFNYTKSIFKTNLIISLANIVLFISGYAIFLLIGPLACLILFTIFFIIFFILRSKYSN